MKTPIKIPQGFAPPVQRDRIFGRVAGGRRDVRAESSTPTIEIFDEIGRYGVSAASVSNALRSAGGKPVTLQINSPGGDIFEGISIYNLLARYAAEVRIEIVGLAASAASLIAMSGDQIAIAQNATIMIHKSWTWALGNEIDFEKTAEILGQIDAAMATTYADCSGVDVETVSEMMATETWLTGDAAKEAGFVHEVIGEQDVSARFDLSPFRHPPAGLSVSGHEPIRPTSPVEFERIIHQHLKLSKADAKLLVRGGWDALSKSAEPSAAAPTSLDFAKFIESVAAATAKLKGKRQ